MPQTEEDRRRVLDLIEDELDELKQLHAVSITKRSGDVFYCVVSATKRSRGGDALDIRTVAVDLEDEAVRVTDNGLWVPRKGSILKALTRMLARSSNDIDQSDPSKDPLLLSAVSNVEPEWLFNRELVVREHVDGQRVDMMQKHEGIDPSRPWGYGAGPPPEVYDVIDRLESAGLDPSEHLTRLVWGKKEPMDRIPRPVEELKGNYGIELLPRDSGLIAIDIDYPEEFPQEISDRIPDTLEVSSPHGDDTQRHVILRCDRKGEIAEQLGAWAVQSAPWGDLWIGDRYVVGPGSQLSEFGCDDGDHVRGDRGGCDACEDPNGGYYEVVNDATIATVEPDLILDLIAEYVDAGDADLRDERTAPDPPSNEDDDIEILKCDSCGKIREEEDLKKWDFGGDLSLICRGGCDG